SIGGTWGNYSGRVWAYCYSGSCPNIGTTTRTYPAPSGSLNRNGGQPITSMNQTWASDTAIAVDDHKIYAGWIETGLPFSGRNCSFHHPYVQSSYEGQWVLLGPDCEAMDSNVATFQRDGERPSLTIVNGTVWASWAESNSAAGMANTVFAKHWNGAGWVGGPIGTRSP